MLDALKIKAEIVKNGHTQTSLAAAMGMTSRTLSTRLKTGDFGEKEIEVMIDILKLEDPMSIFFA